MTLKQLSHYFQTNNEDEDMCEFYKNEYLRINKNKYNYEELDELDIQGLRPYLLCWILAIYEYLANYNKIAVSDWFNKYDNIVCDRQNNDCYNTLVETRRIIGCDDTVADKIFDSFLSKSLPEFKRRGIPVEVLYNNA